MGPTYCRVVPTHHGHCHFVGGSLACYNMLHIVVYLNLPPKLDPGLLGLSILYQKLMCRMCRDASKQRRIIAARRRDVVDKVWQEKAFVCSSVVILVPNVMGFQPPIKGDPESQGCNRQPLLRPRQPFIAGHALPFIGWIIDVWVGGWTHTDRCIDEGCSVHD